VEGHDIDGVSAVMVKIKLPSEREIVVANAHLYYEPYGPYWAMFENRSATEIMKMEQEVRGREISKVLGSLSQYVEHLTPIFLMGDFNSPSHLDWVENTKGEGLRWPVTVQVEEVGLIDSYRAVHPDPVSMPGYTWSPVHTTEYPWGSNPYEPQDRIDFICFCGDVKVVDSQVFVVGVPKTFGSHQENAWPSDHAAVISTFQI
jgi:endonuclease/exonuclease/phosphatase family metal-dependent hydrolase